MNEEQIRRIIREEIRSALRSRADDEFACRVHDYEWTENEVGHSHQVCTTCGEWKKQEPRQAKREQPRVFRNPFDVPSVCRAHHYTWADDGIGHSGMICTICGHEEY